MQRRSFLYFGRIRKLGSALFLVNRHLGFATVLQVIFPQSASAERRTLAFDLSRDRQACLSGDSMAATRQGQPGWGHHVFSRFNRRRESLSSELRDATPRLLCGSESSTPPFQQPEDTYVLLRQSYERTERTKTVQCVGAGRRLPGYCTQN